MHTGEEVRKLGIHSGFETQGKFHQKSKTRVSVAPQKRTDVLQQFKKDKKLCDYLNQNLRSDRCFAIQRNKNQTEK